MTETAIRKRARLQAQVREGSSLPPSTLTSDERTGRCGPRFDGLIWCHAQKGRLYLLVQTGTEIPGQPPVTDEQVEAARMVIAAFMKVL